MSANLTQRETESRAAVVRVHSYRVDVDVRDAADQATPTYPVTVTIELSANGDTWLDFLGDEVLSVEVAGAARQVDYDGARIALTDLPAERCVVRVEALARYSRTGEGLHRFFDPVDGETYLYTQYEPADARRVFPNFEQPDLRAPFVFSLTGPEAWWLGSNEPPASRTTVAPGVVRVEFAQTKPLSTYITCLCAGPYHRVTDRWEDLELGLLCRKSLSPYLDSEELFRETKAGLGWFTTNFGPYPWGAKYDQIFVPEYNLGAMENPGLVTFTEHVLFRSPATPAQLQARCNTVVHEMSHMWFGDLVTMRWWGDLWLKESFAEFMGSHVSVEACGFDDGWVNFAANRKVGAYLADSMPTTHPVVADIADLEAAKTNFDRITYSKGASALTQLVHFVGLDAFLAGARRYFAAHAYSAATLDDFIAALAAVTDRDLSGWVPAWLETAGHDTLAAQCVTAADGTLAELVITRTPPAIGAKDADRVHLTSYATYRLQAGRLVRDLHGNALIDADTVRVPAEGPLPDLVLLNDGDETFAAIGLDERSVAALLTGIGDLDPLPRAVAWTALWHQVRAGLLPPAHFAESVLQAGERQSGMLASLLDWAWKAATRYVCEAEVPQLARRWADGCRTAAKSAEPGSPEQLLWAKAYLRAAALVDVEVREVLAGAIVGLTISHDIEWLVWEALSARGEATDADLDSALLNDPTAAGALARLRCWASRPLREVKAEAWERAHVLDGETNDAVDALLAGFGAVGQGALREPYAAGYFTDLESVWARHPIEIALRLVRGGFPDDGAVAGARWLAAHPAAPETLRRVLAEAVFEAELAARLRGC